jgi:Acyltransferase.
LASGLKRKIIFLANKYLFDIPVVGSLIRKLDAIPLDKKKVDIKALKAALNVLECGGIIGMFPEGGIRKEGHTDITGIEEGILFLAKTSKAPIVPCNIEGSSEVLPVGKYIPKLKKVKIKFFEQIDCTQLTKEDYGYYKQLIYKYINNIQEVEDVQ